MRELDKLLLVATRSPSTCSMFPSTVQSHHHKVAINLNNIGCALLEQGAYLDAMATFHDAVFVMKVICTTTATTATTNSLPHAFLNECIDRANQRLANPQVSSVAFPPSQHDPYGNALSPVFELLTPDDYRHFQFATRILQEPKLILFCPARIEDCSYYSDSYLDLANMLYNLEVSSVCSTKYQSAVSNRDQIAAGAASMLNLADSILQLCQSLVASSSSRSSHANGSSHVVGDEQRRQQQQQQHKLTLNIAVLHSLLQLLVNAPKGSQIDPSLQDDVCVQMLDQLYNLQEQMVYRMRTTMARRHSG